MPSRRRRARQKTPDMHGRQQASSPSNTSANHTTTITTTHCRNLLTWYFHMPLRRTVFLMLYLFECIFVLPFRYFRCCNKQWSIRHAETQAIQEYLLYQSTDTTTSSTAAALQETTRLQQLFDTHAGHRTALSTVLPELHGWYPMGRLIYGASIVQGLKNKLLLLDYFHTTSCSATVTPTLPPQDDDDLVHTPLPPTIWIVGLPRTGSTYFHSILALDTKHIHTYKQWELRNPVPSYATRHHAQEDQRQHKAKSAEWLFDLFFSPLKQIHFVAFDQVDECVQGFVNGVFLLCCLYCLFCHRLTQRFTFIYPPLAGTVNEYYLWGCRHMPLSWHWYVHETDSRPQYVECVVLLDVLCV